jgi:1,3-beta-glucan synthase
MSGYPQGGGHHDYNNDGYANTDSYYQDDHNGQYYDDGYGAHGGHQGNANDGYYDES